MTTASKHMGCLTVAFDGLGTCLKKSDESCICKPTGMPILRSEIFPSSASSKPWAPLQQYFMIGEAFKSIRLLCKSDGVEAPFPSGSMFRSFFSMYCSPACPGGTGCYEWCVILVSEIGCLT